MGLDIWFYRFKRSDWNKYQKEQEKYEQLSKEEQDKLYDEDKTPLDKLHKKKKGEIYFRKVNFLLPYFNYEDNLSYIEISKEAISSLIRDCEEVLDKKDDEVSADLLPTECGFFFGSTDYDEYYYHDVESTYSSFCGFTDDLEDDEVAVMHCWW